MFENSGSLAATVGLALLGGGALVAWDSLAGESGPMSFRFAPIPIAVSQGNDLFEPFVLASPTGALYVAGHSPLTGGKAPGFVSHDNGSTWSPLPANGKATGTEGILAADETGRAWQADFLYPGATSIPLFGYCRDGLVLCSMTPNVYHKPPNCGPPRVDRVWTAYGNDHVWVTNHVTHTTHTLEVGKISTSGNTIATWGCAPGIGYAGVPDVRDSDGTFAVTREQSPVAISPMELVSGTDPLALTSRRIYDFVPYNASCKTGHQNWGYSAFDATGTLFTAAVLREAGPDSLIGVMATRDLQRFHYVNVSVSRPAFLWISGSQTGAGALLSWASAAPTNCGAGTGTTALTLDHYAAHVSLPAFGDPVVSDVSLVTVDGPLPGGCGDYYASSLGPRGEAYLASYSTSAPDCKPTPIGERPLGVFIQDGGPRI